jgi:hypothetical protein
MRRDGAAEREAFRGPPGRDEDGRMNATVSVLPLDDPVVAGLLAAPTWRGWRT